MSKILSEFKNVAWLFLPPLLVFNFVYWVYQTEYAQLSIWFENITWVTHVGLGLSAAIALQFKRSRLVYCCLLLLLFTPFITELFVNQFNFDSIRFNFILLSFVYLMYSRDKGFAPINALFSIGCLAVILFMSIFLMPELAHLIQPLLGKLDSVLLQLSPTLREVVSPFECFLFLNVVLVSLIRFFWMRDHTHNAILFCLVITPLLHFSGDRLLIELGLLFLSALISYSVIKDSFTMAFKDELTTIPSRRALMQYVQTLGRKYTVVMSDIDHFKKFNDTYGHDVGDEVLKLVASKLNQVTGGGKTFRFGGEEFVIIFPRKNANEVVPFVEVVRQVIADYDIALRTKPRPAKAPKTKTKPKKEKIVKVTTSFGIAQRTKEAAEFEQVMKQADIALYAAKKAGRNCVKMAKQ
jgi:diguanylate cyclase (GGDEF)-like protein